MGGITADRLHGVIDWVESTWLRAGLLTALLAQIILLNDLLKRSGVESAPGLENIYAVLIVAPLLAIGLRLAIVLVELVQEWASRDLQEA